MCKSLRKEESDKCFLSEDRLLYKQFRGGMCPSVMICGLSIFGFKGIITEK